MKTSEKKRAYAKEKYASDPAYRGRQLARAAAWRRDNKGRVIESTRDCAYKYLYGISLSDYEAMLVEQDGKCFLCGRAPKVKRLSVDHDHDTGAVRRLLCAWCNNGVGFLENAEWRDKADAYITASKGDAMK